MQIHGVSWSTRRCHKRSPKDPFLTKRCSKGKYFITQEPKGMATLLNEPAKADCMRSLAVVHLPCLSCFAHRTFSLHVKAIVSYGQQRVCTLAHTSATRLCCFEQSITLSTRHCMVWLSVATTDCQTMLCSLQKLTIFCEVNSFALSMYK